ncbi:MAG: adenylate/guanylate cyclase domain-containing protein [Hyphomicrobiales bacterium]|nr:adenylate/guanylate cyclase domain-containing protein [Hyphomicrobiales bacterium]
MGKDEAGTAKAVRERREAATPIVSAFGGRLVKTTGDGVLLEFPSIVAAVECAILMQKMMAERNAALPEAKRIVYRIGVNLGDVLIEGDDILGDGVNVAARLEGLCEPGGVCLSGSAHEHVAGRVAVDFADLGEQSLKNIAKPTLAYGLSPVAVAAARVDMPVAASPPPSVTRPYAPERWEPPRLSLVVLPFANIGGDPEQEYFVDGVTESLTTDLSRIAGSFVIARNTAFTCKGKPLDAKAIGRELNVRYVLEGSVQRGGGRVRVKVQLIDAENGHHLWAERFDKPVADLFEMQDEIVSRLANQLGAALISAEARRAERAPDPDAFDLYLQGMAWFNKGPHPAHLAQARDFFARALALEPNNVDALVGSACADVLEMVDWASAERAARLASAEKSLLKALGAAPDNALAHLWLGLVKTYSYRPDQGIAEAERALALDRNLADALYAVGFAKIFVGRPEETEDHIKQAMRLSPSDSFAFVWKGCAGAAKLHSAAYEEAAAWLGQSVTAYPNFALTRFFLAAALGQLGRLKEARAEAEAGLALNPGFTIRRFREHPDCDNPVYLKQRHNIDEGLRRAGVPEE